MPLLFIEVLGSVTFQHISTATRKATLLRLQTLPMSVTLYVLRFLVFVDENYFARNSHELL